MRRTKNALMAAMLLAMLLLTMPANAQDDKKPQAAPPAPVPASIFTARKAFISNAGSVVDISPDHYSGSPQRAYDQFYAGMKAWGRYELVSDPADADLVLEFHFTVPNYAPDVGRFYDPQFRLVISDMKTHVVLWSFVEHLDLSHVTHDQSFDNAMTKLVDDVRKLATPPKKASGAAN